MSADVSRVAVLGLGLVGGSLARLLHARGLAVVGYDADPAALDAARDAGLETADDVPGVLAGADLVVLAVPLRVMEPTAREVARHVAGTADATVTDVGSVKGPVRRAVEAAGLGERYVGAHPMAGTERSGFGASSADLVRGVPWAVTVTRATAGGRLAALLRLLTGPLEGTVAVLTDELHDEAAALVSHVPHVLATQLLNAVAGTPVREVALGLAAGSFRDGTRVALTDPARTEAMVVENAAWVAPALRRAVRDLEMLVAALETGAPVHGFFHAADGVRAVRREMPAEPGAARARGVQDEPPVALAGDWPAALRERCAAGAVVVGMTADEVLLGL
ncbi:prephenate dehydrogenase [Xylanimonas oleitrophica]|uniref:prephenate dehydrogenase n=1 Tax=Xylanimonas oleitrophica TaxID=2607479 RepID=UPI001FECA155|nr:prephenate dehydrogenase/arogenate dehydrogenase family protein [Xylanimonas oleitrophica]